MTTNDIIALVGLLVVIAGLFATQWRAVQNQRDKDQENNRLLVDGLRAHTDMAIGDVHDRITRANETAQKVAKEEAMEVESRLTNVVRRFDEKLDKLGDKLDHILYNNNKTNGRG